MKRLTNISNLNEYILEPVSRNLDRKLETYRYYDVCSAYSLTTNEKGVDIISHQLEMKFEGNAPIFISWATIDGWFQYSLCVSETSFCNGVETYIKTDDNWTGILGQRLKSFEVYGYSENVVTSTETATGRTNIETFCNEPHLLILHFDNKKLLGLANFYLENDFVPKLPMGDDIWIIFGKTNIDSYIETLSLEQLEV